MWAHTIVADKPEKAAGEIDLDRTRTSLITRLAAGGDEAGWQLFFDIYWKLIYLFALKSGLSSAEAEDVSLETIAEAARTIGAYSKAKGTFRTWLFKLTRWRIRDEFRKRKRLYPKGFEDVASDFAKGSEEIPDPTSELEERWNSEFEMNLLEQAIDRVKRQVDSKRFQIFDLNVRKQWPAARIARLLKVSRARIYVEKHRIGLLIQKELVRLRKKYV